MESRITRAAPHLAEKAVLERMQREQRPWCRRRWEIIYQALTAPRKAEDIARMVGVSPATVHQVISRYKCKGEAAIETAGKGGRRRGYLTLEQERTFLQPFLARVSQGESVTAIEIQRAYEEAIKQSVALSTIYRLLQRHGWRLHGVSACPAPVSENACLQQEPMAVRTHKEPPPLVGEQRERIVQRSRSYPSDLTDQEWAILEPLIPPAKPGGRPRSAQCALLRGSHRVPMASAPA